MYVRLFDCDVERLGGVEELAVHVDGALYLRMIGDRCVALREGGGRFVCSVYERRPDACRALASGSTACVEARRRKGLSTPD